MPCGLPRPAGRLRASAPVLRRRKGRRARDAPLAWQPAGLRREEALVVRAACRGVVFHYSGGLCVVPVEAWSKPSPAANTPLVLVLGQFVSRNRPPSCLITSPQRLLSWSTPAWRSRGYSSCHKKNTIIRCIGYPVCLSLHEQANCSFIRHSFHRVPEARSSPTAPHCRRPPGPSRSPHPLAISSSPPVLS